MSNFEVNDVTIKTGLFDKQVFKLIAYTRKSDGVVNVNYKSPFDGPVLIITNCKTDTLAERLVDELTKRLPKGVTFDHLNGYIIKKGPVKLTWDHQSYRFVISDDQKFKSERKSKKAQ